MEMIDILRNRLPAGISIVSFKEKPSKYIVKFAYNDEQLPGQGELVKACTPGKENMVCDTTIQVAMTGFMLDKGDMAGAKHWMDYAKRAAAAKTENKTAGKAEAILKIIDSHNAVVKILSKCDIPVPEGKMFRAMELWHKLACEGADITHLARENDIDAKCNMQSGMITVQQRAIVEVTV